MHSIVHELVATPSPTAQAPLSFFLLKQLDNTFKGDVGIRPTHKFLE